MFRVVTMVAWFTVVLVANCSFLVVAPFRNKAKIPLRLFYTIWLWYLHNPWNQGNHSVVKTFFSVCMGVCMLCYSTQNVHGYGESSSSGAIMLNVPALAKHPLSYIPLAVQVIKYWKLLTPNYWVSFNDTRLSVQVISSLTQSVLWICHCLRAWQEWLAVPQTSLCHSA